MLPNLKKRIAFAVRQRRINAVKRMVTPARLELPTCGLGNRCSIHLSYGATCLSIGILHGYRRARPSHWLANRAEGGPRLKQPTGKGIPIAITRRRITLE